MNALPVEESQKQRETAVTANFWSVNPTGIATPGVDMEMNSGTVWCLAYAIYRLEPAESEVF